MRYESPESIEGAVALLANGGGGRILAGGPDLLVQLRAGMTEPELLVDIKKIREAREITSENGGYRVGAAVSGAELGEHTDLKHAWPGVVEAVELIGSTQIQGRASMGGNLCNASPAADSVPALIAAAAVCTVAGSGGQREVAVEEICTGPGQTSLGKGEFVDVLRRGILGPDTDEQRLVVVDAPPLVLLLERQLRREEGSIAYPLA